MSLLTVTGLHCAYGPVRVLHGIDLTVAEGEIVSVLGANGAGKTTLLRALSGLIRFQGRAMLDGEPIEGCAPSQLVRRGLSHVPQGRGTLRSLSVHDNLMVGATHRRDRAGVRRSYEDCLARFPRLEARLEQRATTLSGGEQQMLAIARALMADPRILLLDEPSLGLAPRLVAELLAALAALRQERGMALVVVEQNAAVVLDLADRAYVLENGRVALSGPASAIASDDGVKRAYLGV